MSERVRQAAQALIDVACHGDVTEGVLVPYAQIDALKAALAPVPSEAGSPSTSQADEDGDALRLMDAIDDGYGDEP